MCSVWVLDIWLSFPPLCTLALTVSQLCILLCLLRLFTLVSSAFQFCIIYYACLVSAYSHLQYFSSAYFTFLSSSPHINLCSISVLYIFVSFFCLCILTSGVFQFYILYFAFLVLAYLLKSPKFEFRILYFLFLVCAYWHMQYFSFV